MEENYQAGQVAAGQVAAGLEAGPDAERLERRGNPRYAVDAAATLVVVNQGGVLSGRIFDLSLDGCGLRTESRQSLTAPVPVEISFKTNGIAFRFAGVMERTDDQSVAGVRFGAMPLRRREVLIEVLEELDAKEKARAATSESPEADKPQPVPGNAPDRPAKVPPASSPRTAASSPPKAEAAAATQRTPLTGSLPAPVTPRAPVAPPAPVTPRAPVAPPAPVAPSAPAAPSPPRRGSDRRAQRRHTVDTRAVIYFIDVAAAVNGRILDLSLSGCRIRTDERFPSGIYRRIETEFRAAGLPFRLAGVVQSVHDRHTVGIRFLDLSERKRGQLCELMEEIADGQPNPEPGAGITAPDPPQPEAPSPQSS